MSYIEERQLKDYERNAFLGHAKIQEREGNFTLIVTVKGNATEEFIICTQRKAAREWQSLDRMLKHYRKIIPSVKQYQLTFTSEPIP